MSRNGTDTSRNEPQPGLQKHCVAGHSTKLSVPLSVNGAIAMASFHDRLKAWKNSRVEVQGVLYTLNEVNDDCIVVTDQVWFEIIIPFHAISNLEGGTSKGVSRKKIILIAHE
ncbi:hypothetical protein D3C76_1304820 [compost metagenome]